MISLARIKSCIKQSLVDFECGNHSGFKPCCIFCFAVLDNLSHLNNSTFYSYRRYINRIVSVLLDKDYKYIPCPVCLFFDPVELKKCKRVDHKFTVSVSDWDNLHGSYQEFASKMSNIEYNLHKIDRIFEILEEQVVGLSPWFENRKSW